MFAVAAAALALVFATGAPDTVAASNATTTTKSGGSAGLYVRGAGYGHGVGMSQYGAAGYAQHGYSYRQILQRYYAQTTLGVVSPDRPVTVLLRARGSATFSGAVKIAGAKLKLKPATSYSVIAAGSQLRLVAGRHSLGSFAAPLQVTGAGPLMLLGLGTYRGSFVFRPAGSGGGVMTVNSLPLDSYVRGVVSAEMPSDWPRQALEAQAVAARTYAITTGAAGADFDVYDTTRSQMYEGVRAETASGDAAVAATRGQVVEYDGRPVTTFFFSSSGGRTESVQNVFTGIAPEAWLVSEPDPYDDSFANPHYRWKLSLGLSAADSRLGKLVDGRLKGIRIVKHGVSPRVIEAQVVGTKGTTTTSGVQLQKDLAAPSTWMSFTTITARGVQTTSTVAETTTTTASTTTAGGSGGGSGGVGVGSAARRHAAFREASVTRAVVRRPPVRAMVHRRYAVAGSIYPVTLGRRIIVERDSARGWHRVGAGSVSRAGAYSVAVPGPGSYRVLYGRVIAREITVT